MMIKINLPASCRSAVSGHASRASYSGSSRPLSAFHSLIASSGSVAFSRSKSQNPPGASSSPTWNRQCPSGVHMLIPS